MTARGVDFLENWIANNVPAEPGNWDKAEIALDFEAAGFTLYDIEIEDPNIENIILGAMIYGDGPGTPGD